MNYDVVIVGAGLSGLAAGLRLAQFDKKVLIAERHYLWGGLNSFYKRAGNLIDVGLHAVTNWVAPEYRGPRLPLQRICRQLRIRMDELDLVPQSQSSIRFGDVELPMTNRFADLADGVAQLFPDDIDGFIALSEATREYPPAFESGPFVSTREMLARYLKEPLLADMLMCPLFFYGNPRPKDMDWREFIILFNSIYREGFCRPRGGMRPLLRQLVDRFQEAGGTLQPRCAVGEIRRNGVGLEVELEGKGTVTTRHVLSSAGRDETLRLLGRPSPSPTKAEPPRLGFVEVAWVLDRPLSSFGHDDCITFFNRGTKFDWSIPDTDVDVRSGVLCAPSNYPGVKEPRSPMLRATHLTPPSRWFGIDRDTYLERKAAMMAASHAEAEHWIGSFGSHVTFADAFTPATVHRFTGHDGGAIYGAPNKERSAETGVDDVFLIGTDHGLIGIVGAMLSGVSVANQKVLS